MIAVVEEWEKGPDVARGLGDPHARVEARVLLVFGDQAEVVTPYHDARHPLRMPAAVLAEQLGVGVGVLPSVRFSAVLDGDVVREAELLR